MRPGSFGIAILALALLLPSCRSMSGNETSLLFPKLRPGVPIPKANARMTGTLIRDGAFLRVAGGTTIIVWPLAADAVSRPGNGNVIVVWPRSATLQRPGGGTTVIIWARGIGSGTPVRVGDRVELSGIVLVDNLPAQAAGGDIITADNVSGRIANCPRERGCVAPMIIVTEFRPAPPGS
jgi:hypothetical protein